MLATPASCQILNAMSVDVEDYFQVQAFASTIDRAQWDNLPSRVERNADMVLGIFAATDAKATFFVLGWIAERYPELVRRIAAQGHEIASHGMQHQRVDQQSPGKFAADVRRAKLVLEQCAGVAVRGYRAATFSIGPSTPWAWNILEDEGYSYSSSIYPIAHDLYGFPDAPRSAYQPDGTTDFIEIPIATVRAAGRNWPSGGGGYFRLLPYQLSRAAIAHINKRDRLPAVFYLHPWEIDPAQPRMRNAPLKSRLRHYVNLSRTAPRLVNLLHDFRWGRIDEAFAISRHSVRQTEKDA